MVFGPGFWSPTRGSQGRGKSGAFTPSSPSSSQWAGVQGPHPPHRLGLTGHRHRLCSAARSVRGTGAGRGWRSCGPHLQRHPFVLLRASGASIAECLPAPWSQLLRVFCLVATLSPCLLASLPAALAISVWPASGAGTGHVWYYRMYLCKRTAGRAFRPSRRLPGR